MVVPRKKPTLLLYAGDLVEAMSSLVKRARNGPYSKSYIDIRLLSDKSLSISCGRRRALVPVSVVIGSWPNHITVDGRLMAVVSDLFRATQRVEIVADRRELIVCGAGFRLCTKRLETITPRAKVSLPLPPSLLRQFGAADG
jgi:hypothetical protein